VRPYLALWLGLTWLVDRALHCSAGHASPPALSPATAPVSTAITHRGRLANQLRMLRYTFPRGRTEAASHHSRPALRYIKTSVADTGTKHGILPQYLTAVQPSDCNKYYYIYVCVVLQSSVHTTIRHHHIIGDPRRISHPYIYNKWYGLCWKVGCL
jgi:hypothetical protein